MTKDNSRWNVRAGVLLGAWLGLSGAQAAERLPVLPELAAAVRSQTNDPVAASRLGSALMHRDWMLPVEVAADAAWAASGVRRSGESGSLDSPDGRRRVEWQGTTLKLVALPDGSPISEVQTGRPWETIQWHPAGWAVALAGTNGLEIRDGKTLRQASGDCVGAVGPALAFSPDGLQLLTARAGGGVALWDWAGVRQVSVGLPGWGAVESVAFDPRGERARVRAGGREQVLDLRPGRALSDWYGSTGSVRTAVFSKAGDRVMTASGDGWVQFREVGGAGRSQGFQLANVPTALSATPDGKWLVTALSPGKARIWDVATGRPRGAWMPHNELTQVANSARGDWVWTVSPSMVRAWNLGDPSSVPVGVVTNGRVHRLASDRACGTVAVLLSEPEGPLVRLWATTNPVVPLKSLPTWDAAVVELDPSGEWLLTTSTNGGLRQRRWTAGGTEPGRPDIGVGAKFAGARYSGDGRHVLTVTAQGVMRTWDSATGKPVGSKVEVPGLVVDAVELSPDGTKLRIEEAGGVVQVYDVATGRPATEPWWPPLRRARSVRVDASRFSRDGSAVLVPDGDLGVRLVPLPPSMPAPVWLASLAEAVWGLGTNAPSATVTGVRGAVDATGEKEPWRAWGKWWLSDRGTRSVVPGAGVTPEALAKRHLEPSVTTVLPEALRLAPGSQVVRDAVIQQARTNQFWSRPYRAELGEWLGKQR
jgi:WD40 repeat protein